MSKYFTYNILKIDLSDANIESIRIEIGFTSCKRLFSDPNVSKLIIVGRIFKYMHLLMKKW